MGFFDSDAAAATPAVLPVHGAFDYLADSRHDVLAARPRAALLRIADVTSQSRGQA